MREPVLTGLDKTLMHFAQRGGRTRAGVHRVSECQPLDSLEGTL
jgi:hypothetical protein